MVLVRENYMARSAPKCNQLLFIQHKPVFDAGHVSRPREVNQEQIKSILGLKVNEWIFFSTFGEGLTQRQLNVFI